MPYNTRRKSLSLPALGIQLPSASRAHRPSTSKLSAPSNPTESCPPPTKKVKRSHTTSASSPTLLSRPRSSTASSISSTKTVSFAERPRSSGRTTYQHTPPPSPGPENEPKIDTDGINDVIVVGVIEQLEKTGNRPHLIKELAAVLSTTSDAVSSSANPGALLSSRLAAYLRRPCWSALSPCPIAKELIPTHPRRVFYYLITSTRQEIPVDSSDILSPTLITTVGDGGKGGNRIISPSLSNASMDEDVDGDEERKREALSPSPEIDLSAPELDSMGPGVDDDFNPPTSAGSSFSSRSSLARDGSSGSSSETINLAHNHRGASPPLEGDEREFTQTASSVRMRGISLGDSSIRLSKEAETINANESNTMDLEETEEEKVERNNEAAAALFGGEHQQPVQEGLLRLMSSPMMNPISGSLGNEIRKEVVDVEMEAVISVLGDQGLGSTWNIKKPENVDLDELDDLFGDF